MKGRGAGSRYTMAERLELMEHSSALGSQLWSGYQLGSTVPRALLDRYDLRLATPLDSEYWTAPQPLYGAPFVLVPKAGGGRVRGGETTLVGERGPEIVRLPAGSDVIPAHRSRMLMEGQAQRQPVPAGDRELHVHQYLDGREVARSTVRHPRRRRAVGLAMSSLRGPTTIAEEAERLSGSAGRSRPQQKASEVPSPARVRPHGGPIGYFGPADERQLHVHQYLDGREVARSTVRNLDDEQWGWR